MVNIQEHTTPEKLERYAFLWSEVRLVIAAVALFLGGIPPVLLIFRGIGLVTTLLNLCWIISGVAAGYLFYKWWHTKTVFGGKDKQDLGAFAVMIISGLNLGLAGVLSQNIGMSISQNNRIIFILAGVVYLFTAYHLWKRWKAHGEKLF